MFKPHRIVFTALPLVLLYAPLVFLQTSLQTSSQSLPQAKLFAEGVINTDADEYGPALAPDGKTLYFARRVNRRDSEFIYVSRLESGKWSMPELAPFSGKYFDKEPFVAPDGKRIFFASLRPVDGVEPKNHRNGRWTEPKNFGAAINTTDFEYTPLISPDGRWLFFSRGWGEIYYIDWKARDLAVETDRSLGPKPAASSAAYKAFLGQYEMAEFGVMVTVTLDGDRLMIESSRGVTVELLPLSGNRFKVAGVDGQVTFVTDEKGQVTHFLGVENGREATAKKIK
jgi:Tol biopolymer transport system component